MYRVPLIAAGTVVGAAGVFAFPVQHPAMTVVGVTPEPHAPGATSATGTDEQYQYGDIAVTVTVEGGRVTDVSVATLNPSNAHSASIDSYAIPLLEKQVISADSAKIQGVSGATFTSAAFAASAASALEKLGFTG